MPILARDADGSPSGLYIIIRMESIGALCALFSSAVELRSPQSKRDGLELLIKLQSSLLFEFPIPDSSI